MRFVRTRYNIDVLNFVSKTLNCNITEIVTR